VGQVLPLRSKASVDDAWNRYQALAQAAVDDPRLTTDRNHIQATIRAHKAFADAFLASEKA
jgi:hypothetical protein